MIRVKVRGSTKKTESFLRRAKKVKFANLEKYGEMGVAALSAATPVRTGLTAASWSYEIKPTATGYSIIWKNSNVVDGYPVAVLIQYGHGTRNGGYVEGIDYINPALETIFQQIADDAFLEVTK